MCGGSAQTTQQIQIPPEVLARYNSVNARAEDVASKGFQQYGTDPSAFVAPLSQTQQAGVANVNAAQNIAQPYFQGATSQLMGAQQNALPYFDQATQSLLGGQQAGVTGTQGAYQPMQQAAQYAKDLQGGALNQYQTALQVAQPYNQAAATGLAGAYAGAQPYQNMATGLAAAGTQAVNAGPLGGEQINQYMSPYLNSVVGSTMANLRQQQGQEQSSLLGNQIAQGAFGGDRGRIAQANLARQQNLATGQTVSGLMNQGYGQALGAAQQQQQLGLGAAQANRAALQQGANQMLGIGQQGYGQGIGSAQAMAGLGQQQYGQYSGLGQNLASLGQQGFGQGAAQTAQQAALAQQLYGMGAGTAGQLAGLGQGIYGMGAGTSQALAGLGSQAQQNALGAAQAQLGAGTLQQQTEQAGKTALYNQFLQEQGFPYQQAQFLGNIAMGTGALSGSTTQTTQPAPFFSDKRLKEAVEPIGKTFDGQNIVKFRYKNEPGTRIGLIAQDVEKHHPEAVGLAGGYKTVDYDKATEAAARKGKYAHGGLIPQSEGGAVTPFRAGQGYADGGSPSIVGPTELAALQEALQAQLAMYGGAGLNISGTPGATGVVPAANLPTANLVTAGPLPAALNSGIKDAADTGEKIAGLYKSGKEFYGDVTEDEDEPKKDKAYGGLAGHYAMGGMPGKEGYIPEDIYKPEDEKKKEIETPGAPGQGKSDFSQAVDAAKTAAQIAAMFAARGGRIGKLVGGGLFLNPAGDFDAEEERNKLSDLNQYGRNTPDTSVQTAPIERSPVLAMLTQAQRPQPAAQVNSPAARPTAQVAKRTSPGVAPPLSAPVDVPARPPIRSEETGAGMAQGLGGGNPPPPISSDLAGSPAYQQRGLAPVQAPTDTHAAENALLARTGLSAPNIRQDLQKDANKKPSFLEKAERMLAPKGGYLDRLSQGDEDTIVSLLSGIGAMAGSQNRYGLGALAEGVGAGAGAYQKAKQNILGRKETEADIGFKQAQTAREYGLTPGSGRFKPYGANPYGYVVFDTVNNKPLTQAEYNRERQLLYADPSGRSAFASVANAALATPDAQTGQMPVNQATTVQPISFRAGDKAPTPESIASEFGQESITRALAGSAPVRTEAELENRNKLIAAANDQAAEDKIKLDNAVAGFGPTFGNAMIQFGHVSDYLKVNELNRATPVFADLIGTILSLPGIKNFAPDAARDYQAAADYTKKVAVLQAMQNAGGLAGAPAAALAAGLEAVPNPEMAPKAKYDIMSQAVASLLQQKAYNDTYTQYRDQIYDVNKFTQKFYADRPLDSFVPEAKKMLGPAFAGMKNPTPSSNETGKPYTQADTDAVKAGTMPEGTIRMFKGQPVKWNGTNWVKTGG